MGKTLFVMEENMVQRLETRMGKGETWGKLPKDSQCNFYVQLFIFLGVQALCCYFNHQTYVC